LLTAKEGEDTHQGGNAVVSMQWVAVWQLWWNRKDSAERNYTAKCRRSIASVGLLHGQQLNILSANPDT